MLERGCCLTRVDVSLVRGSFHNPSVTKEERERSALTPDAGLEACMMIHPVGGMGVAAGTAGVAPTLAINTVNVEFFGKTSHAGGAPWDGVNALDAVNIAYSSISAMRQQMHPTDRVHGIIIKGGDAPNSE